MAPRSLSALDDRLVIGLDDQYIHLFVPTLESGEVEVGDVISSVYLGDCETIARGVRRLPQLGSAERVMTEQGFESRPGTAHLQSAAAPGPSTTLRVDHEVSTCESEETRVCESAAAPSQHPGPSAWVRALRLVAARGFARRVDLGHGGARSWAALGPQVNENDP